MKKLPYYIASILIIASLSGLVLSGFADKNQRRRNIDQILSYKDSIVKEKALLGLMRAHIVLSDRSATDLMRMESAQIDERMRINKRIWGYQWKIDSLELELKK